VIASLVDYRNIFALCLALPSFSEIEQIKSVQEMRGEHGNLIRAVSALKSRNHKKNASKIEAFFLAAFSGLHVHEMKRQFHLPASPPTL
jgi:hypothetical protein